MGRQVLLYWPNIIGYARLLLLCAAWAVHQNPVLFVQLYLLSVVLDGVDGWLARRLDQTSRFGAWLDIVVDNLGRGMLWSVLYQWGWLVSALEWCVFVCNYGSRGDRWKDSFSTSPRLIRAVMADGEPPRPAVRVAVNVAELTPLLPGFRTPVGVWVVSGLHLLPVWLYARRWGLLSSWLLLPAWVQTAGTLLLAGGRLLALSAEVWCIWRYIEDLTSDEKTT